MKHVLAVDDDPAIRNMIADYLGEHHFRVSAVASGREMARALKAGPVDLVILDVQLDDEDGLELMRDLRAGSSLPIIVLSGHRREEVDRVIGLELGADDYLTKPVSLRELLARIRAALRRAETAPKAKPDGRRVRYRFAGWELSLRTRRLTAPSGDAMPLTRGEFNLLVAFLEAPQRVLSREQLLAASRVHDADVFDRSIDVQILRLRRKLEPNPSEPQLIRTERGVGYVFATSVEIL